MKTSRSGKDPILPGELIILLILGAVALLAGLLLNPIMYLIHYFRS